MGTKTKSFAGATGTEATVLLDNEPATISHRRIAGRTRRKGQSNMSMDWHDIRTC